MLVFGGVCLQTRLMFFVGEEKSFPILNPLGPSHFVTGDIPFIHGIFPWICCIPASKVSIEPLHCIYIYIYIYILHIYIIYSHISSIASDNKPKRNNIPPSSTPKKNTGVTRRWSFFPMACFCFPRASQGSSCWQELKEVWEFWLKDSNGGTGEFTFGMHNMMFPSGLVILTYCWWFRHPEKNHQLRLRLVVYPILYMVSYILGCARFQPSTVWQFERFMIDRLDMSGGP